MKTFWQSNTVRLGLASVLGAVALYLSGQMDLMGAIALALSGVLQVIQREASLKKERAPQADPPPEA